ncbi:CBU_0592 family membrane protein [Microbispora sp. ATCC PTA-5024]|uniref:CBU_0592 family membrane protein n=1 Tax=Microbispora sp. ATCC PTA-5024 TaxID=316330 RepID=UPI0003DBC33B|nr:hypothetical protein [Microbispora sp. ATCC PTA-5024]ETK36033.1 hypothetical protein MPTA5024_10440 [Microbispora sp. ATCC PTA-5024]
MSTFVTIIGTIGAVVLLYGYAMVSAGRMSGNGLTYQVLNFAGAATLMVNSAYHAAWPSAILNMVWSGIGVVTLSRLVARRASRRSGRAAEPAAVEGGTTREPFDAGPFPTEPATGGTVRMSLKPLEPGPAVAARGDAANPTTLACTAGPDRG